MLANEVVDALPACRLRSSGGRWRELRVGAGNGALHWLEADLESQTAALAACLPDAASYPDGYTTELNTSMPDWIARATRPLRQGVFLCMDYGYPRRDYMHPQRSMGTLLCHYRHRAHDNPFDYIGVQDITTSVDFTLLAEQGCALGMRMLGYNTQAGFLLALGMDKLLTDGVGKADEARQLLLPGAMGDRFHVLALGRETDQPLTGFSLQDQSWRL